MLTCTAERSSSTWIKREGRTAGDDAAPGGVKIPGGVGGAGGGVGGAFGVVELVGEPSGVWTNGILPGSAASQPAHFGTSLPLVDLAQKVQQLGLFGVRYRTQ